MAIVAQDLSSVKSNFASQTGTMAQKLLNTLRSLDEFVAEYFALGLNSGGANQLQQADLVGANAYLTPAAIGAVITQSQAASAAVTSGGRDVLRQAMVSPQAPIS